MTIFMGYLLKIRCILSISFSLLLLIASYLNAGFNARANLNFDLKKTNTFVFEVIDFPENKPKSIGLIVHCIFRPKKMEKGFW